VTGKYAKKTKEREERIGGEEKMRTRDLRESWSSKRTVRNMLR